MSLFDRKELPPRLLLVVLIASDEVPHVLLGVVVGEVVVDGDVARHVPHPEPGHHIQHAHLALDILNL